jgi:hypothetical protein
VCKGRGEYGGHRRGGRLRQINTCLQVPLLVNFLEKPIFRVWCFYIYLVHAPHQVLNYLLEMDTVRIWILQTLKNHEKKFTGWILKNVYWKIVAYPCTVCFTMNKFINSFDMTFWHSNKNLFGNCEFLSFFDNSIREQGHFSHTKCWIKMFDLRSPFFLNRGVWFSNLPLRRSRSGSCHQAKGWFCTFLSFWTGIRIYTDLYHCVHENIDSFR